METFGSRISSEISTLGREAETHPPVLRQYDGWGKRVDQLVTSEAWRKLHDISAEEGLVAIGYERQYGEWRYTYMTHNDVIIINIFIVDYINLQRYIYLPHHQGYTHVH